MIDTGIVLSLGLSRICNRQIALPVSRVSGVFSHNRRRQYRSTSRGWGTQPSAGQNDCAHAAVWVDSIGQIWAQRHLDDLKHVENRGFYLMVLAELHVWTHHY